MIRLRQDIFVVILFVVCCGMPATQAQKKRPKSPKLPPGTIAHRNLEYVKNGHERHRLDLYLPEKAKNPLPVIVWVHVGGWRNGSKERCPAIGFTTKGFSLASINYRLSGYAVFPAQIQDCKAAVRWLRANAKNYNLDGKHFGVWGSSAGGHLAALLGTSGGVKELEGKRHHLDQSSRVQAVVDWFGPTDFTKMGGWPDNADSPESRLLKGAVQANKDKAAMANPITHVSKDDPPFLIMHGGKDKLVPLSQSTLLKTALDKAAVPVSLQILEGAGHGGKDFSTAERINDIESFFRQHLR